MSKVELTQEEVLEAMETIIMLEEFAEGEYPRIYANIRRVLASMLEGVEGAGGDECNG